MVAALEASAPNGPSQTAFVTPAAIGYLGADRREAASKVFFN
jgi:hypothetical protein